MRLHATPLPAAVEENESLAIIRLLTHAGMLQAILPPWDEITGTYSGPAWVIRLTQKGIEAALRPPGQ